MRSESGGRPTTFRGAATVLAATGALLFSGGLALMTTATTATADQEVHTSYVCKYVGKPGGETEVLQSGQNPILVDNHSLDPSAEQISVGDRFADAHGSSVVLIANTGRVSPEPGRDACLGDLATATVGFTDPPCEAPSRGTYSATGKHVELTVTGSVSTGDTMTVTAHALPGYRFAEGAQVVWEHAFTAPTGCTVTPPVVEPPVVGPPVVSPPSLHAPVAGVTTPTVVEAGLSGSSTASHGGAAWLLVTGLVLLAGAGGLAEPGRRGRDSA
jgi:hypothetical protein